MGGSGCGRGLSRGRGFSWKAGLSARWAGLCTVGVVPPQVGVAFGLGAWLPCGGRGFLLTEHCLCEVGVASLMWAWLWVGGASPKRAWLLLGRRGSSSVGVA